MKMFFFTQNNLKTSSTFYDNKTAYILKS